MIKKIKNEITKLLPYDKLLHFLGGTYIALIALSLSTWWVALLATLIIATWIEVYDSLSGKGTAEILDIVYTMAGGIAVVLIGVI